MANAKPYRVEPVGGAGGAARPSTSTGAPVTVQPTAGPWVGGQGTKLNVARSQQFRSYGYPAASPFNGQSQCVCRSGRLADDNPNTRPGPLTIRISCNMTGGSSGGGWLINEVNGLGFVNSVNSYKHVSGPLANVNHMYGPYFGSAALSLFNATVAKG